jgi:hypothetical protein
MDRREVVALSEGAVEIDHVQPFRTVLDESPGDGGGIVAVHLLSRGLALGQSNDSAAADIDGGVQEHWSGGGVGND